MKNIEKKRREIETLLLSTVICPDVKNRIDDSRFKSISWSKARDAAVHKTAIENHVIRAVLHVGTIKEITKAIRNCTHVFEELGFNALVFYIDKVIVNQIKVKAWNLKEQVDITSVRLGDRMLRGIPHLKSELGTLYQGLEADPVVQETDSMSMKVRCLIDLLIPLFRENGSGYRGIVFVERVALVSSMAKVLNDGLTSLKIRCGAVAGTGSQNENERQSQLDMFRSGKIQILVSTAALEEGIDVTECAFVVRYTSITTTKAHIQGAGRARHPKALIFYFENDPYLERRKEKALNDAAKDKSLSLTMQELQKAATSINIPFGERHPYPFQARRGTDANDEGEVNVFNCKQIFNQYCSMSLGASIQPKKTLYKYESTGGRKVLSMVRYPSPHGWVTLSYGDFKSFWGNTDFEPIFCAQRVKRKTTSEKEEMCFVYKVVVQLREDKYLNSHNKVNPTIGIDVRQNCPLDAGWPRTISINNRVFQSENVL
jgi:endoribonuclease Dicer